MPHSSMRRSRQSAVLAAIVGVAFALGCGSDNDAPTTPRVVTKTVAITGGQGSGRVTSSEGKLDCRLTNGAASGPTCAAAFDSGSVAALTAVPDAGQEFVAWSGDCTADMPAQRHAGCHGVAALRRHARLAHHRPHHAQRR